jgi:hypothetical protein
MEHTIIKRGKNFQGTLVNHAIWYVLISQASCPLLVMETTKPEFEPNMCSTAQVLHEYTIVICYVL